MILEVTEELYLGDLISSNGKNTKNIKNRISKGIGIISQIMNILESTSFGPHYFEIAMLLRESLLVNGVTTNAEVWHNITESEMSEFESLDKLFFRRLLSVPKSTPIEALYLELGAIPMGIMIKARRLNYLHSVLRRNPDSMLYRFFVTQHNFPCKGDWTEIVKKDLEDFNITNSFDCIKSKSKDVFKKLVRQKSRDFALKKLTNMQQKHSKMKNLYYKEIKTQNYFSRDDIDNEQKKMLFQYRTRMAEYGENFRGGRKQVTCPLCNNHLDKQELSYTCSIITNKLEIQGEFTDIYSDHINKQTVETLQQITKLRKLIISDKHTLLPQLAHVSLGEQETAMPSAAQNLMCQPVPFSFENLD